MLPVLPLTHPGSQVTFQECMPLEPPAIFRWELVKRRRRPMQIKGYEIVLASSYLFQPLSRSLGILPFLFLSGVYIHAIKMQY